VQKVEKYQSDPVAFCTQVLGDRFTDDIKKVMLSVRDNPVTIARSCNGPGKSFGAARIATWFFCVYNDAKVFLTAAPPLENLKNILWGELATVVNRNPHLFAGCRIRRLDVRRYFEKDVGRESEDASFIAGLTIPTSGTAEQRQTKFSGKHSPHLLFIVDEGDAVPEEVYRGIESCMSGGMARLLILFNPKAMSGPIYLKEKDKQANVIKLSAFSHPNVITGQDIFPGAVDRQTTVRRINEWTRPLTQDECKPKDKSDIDVFAVPDFLVGTTATALDGRMYDPLPPGKRKIVEPAFSYMVLGEYPAQSEFQLINREWVETAQRHWREYRDHYGEYPPVGVKPLMGVDVAEMGTDYSCACFRYGSYVPRFTRWYGIDSDATAVKALELYRLHNVEIAMIDATGYGSAVAPSMVRMDREQHKDHLPYDPVRAGSIKVADAPLKFIETELGKFYMLRDQLWWACREWLRTDPKAMLPPDPYLADELCTPTYNTNFNERGKIKIMDKKEMRELLRRSPDRADALCLTFAPYSRPKILRLNY